MEKFSLSELIHVADAVVRNPQDDTRRQKLAELLADDDTLHEFTSNLRRYEEAQAQLDFLVPRVANGETLTASGRVGILIERDKDYRDLIQRLADALNEVFHQKTPPKFLPNIDKLIDEAHNVATRI